MFARVVVLTLGIVGGLSAGVVGIKWMGASGHIAAVQALPDVDEDKKAEAVASLEAYSSVSYVLLASGVLGLLGGILGGMGKKWIALLLLWAAVPGPLLYSLWLIVPTTCLWWGGFFAFFIRPPRFPYEQGLGGCWNGFKGWFNLGGVKLKLEGVDNNVPKAGTLITGNVQLLAKSEKHVYAVHYKLVRKRSKGRGDDKEDSEDVLGETSAELGLDLQKGETRMLDFALPYKFSKGVKDMGGVLGGVGKLAAFATGEKDEYYLVAEAEVAGSLFDASNELLVNMVD